MEGEAKAAHLVGVDHRIQYTNATCGPEWTAEICKFEDYLVDEVARLNVDLLAEEFSEELVHRNCATGCTVRDAARRAGKPHVFCDPDQTERAKANIATDEQREKEWLTRIERTKAHRPLIVCGNLHIDSFARRLQEVGFSVAVLSRNWGTGWQFKN